MSDYDRFNPSVDDQTAQEKLQKFSGPVSWDYLHPHFESGALLYVDASKSLLEVGDALSSDNAEKIKNWLQDGSLVKPCDAHVAYWKELDATFQAMIVRPFVLFQIPTDNPQRIK